ncbi:hypothetical protein M2272_004636 [Mycobacterium frederiksbergense]|uniref:DUF4129 domain-containing protein n=1 Tax=Mycolicibacterium frederiksbergense TaxID=117567 RepID=A0ABT6L6L4_9MYCO|nr:hypothetical protein [Mycolicibacterium frederiksbergense]MDH6197980.1 hypothetical protein [Mycolicibacterium frederiksbergense]
MPDDDLLRFIGGPLALSGWWLALAALIVAVLAAWYAAVVIWTLPPQRLRTIPVLRDWHARLTRRRFARTIEETTARYGRRELSREDAATAYNHTLRSFLYLRTGVYAKNLLTDYLAQSELSNAVPLLTLLHDAQFNPESRADVLALGRSAEELIRAWT